jgi:GT2 family glycosyltransferase
LLKNCLDSVLAGNYKSFEVIFVDNRSDDGSVDFVEANYSNNSKIKIIINPQNLGFAEGNNVGIGHARGKYVVFLNNDTVVDPNWLTAMVPVLEQGEQIAIAQSKLVLTKSKKIDSTGDFITFYGYGYLRGFGKNDIGQYDSQTQIFSARGAAFTISREILLRIGGFDPSYVFSYEDIDLSWRTRLMGLEIVLVPTSLVYHMSYGTRNGIPSAIMNFHLTKNRLMTFLKNFSYLNLVKSLPVLVSGDILITSFLSIKKAQNNLLSTIKAYFWVLLNLKEIWRKRIYVQSTRSVSDLEITQYMPKICLLSILINWFLFYRHRINFLTFSQSCIEQNMMKLNPNPA